MATAKTSVARGLVRAVDRAWRSLVAHEQECALCVDHGYGEQRRYERCDVGRLLLRCWCDLRDLLDQPSRWNVVEVVLRPGTEERP